MSTPWGTVRSFVAERPLLVAVLLLGATLRVWQYAGCPSLWLDEIAVARAIEDIPLGDLVLKPLPYNQVAPVGFLVVEKGATVVLGAGDHALRLFPFVCSLLALLAFSRLSDLVLSPIPATISVALFATAAPLISYAAVVKQYETDVSASVVLLCLALEIDLGRARRAAAIALLGAVLVWFSQAACLVALGLGAVLALLPSGNRGEKRPGSVGVACAWGASALLALWSAAQRVTPFTLAYLRRFWERGFPPAHPTSVLSGLSWPIGQLNSFLAAGDPGTSLGYPAPAAYLLLGLVGVLVLVRRRTRTAACLLAPALVTLAASALRLYPWSERLILFLLPSFFILLAAGISWVSGVFSFGSGVGASLLSLCLLAPAMAPTLGSPPVYQQEDMKPVLAFVRAHWRDGDSAYVYYGAGPAVAYYGARYGFSPGSYLLGGCHRGAARLYLKELDHFRSRSRLWVIVTHAGPFYREREDLIGYLDAIGERSLTFTVASRAVGWKPYPAEAFLYDLSDERMLARTSAEDFDITGPAMEDEKYPCDGGPLSLLPAPRGARPAP